MKTRRIGDFTACPMGRRMEVRSLKSLKTSSLFSPARPGSMLPCRVGKSSRAETLGVHLDKALVKIVAARGDACGAKKSKFAAQIIEWWASQGFPEVSAPDASTRTMVMDSLDAKDFNKFDRRLRTLLEQNLRIQKHREQNVPSVFPLTNAELMALPRHQRDQFFRIARENLEYALKATFGLETDSLPLAAENTAEYGSKAPKKK